MADKIIIQDNKIIFDGHAETLRDCQLITAVCDALEQSNNFKTVKYESGYAEFEKVSGGERAMFVVHGVVYICDNTGQLNFGSISTNNTTITVTSTGLTWTGNAGDGSWTYEGRGTFLGVSETAEATTPDYAVGTTFTKGSSDWDPVYAVSSEPNYTVSGVVELKSIPSLPASVIDCIYSRGYIDFTSNGTSYDGIVVGLDNINWGNYTIEVYNSTDGWVNDNYRFLDFGSTPQVINDKLYEWIETNMVQPSLTYDLSQLDLPEGTHSITVVAKADGYSNSAPSEAVEYVVEPSLPVWNGTDLTGTTWYVPSGWSATNGYGNFNVNVKFVDGESGYNYLIGSEYKSFKIGYSVTSSKENYVALYNSTSSRFAMGNSSSFTVKFLGGTDVTNTKLISWLKQYGTLTSHTMA